MESDVVDIHQRFDLSQTVSLVKQLTEYFQEAPVRIMTQLGLFPGYDEVVVLLKSSVVYRCLVSDGKQVSDWMLVEKGDQK